MEIMIFLFSMGIIFGAVGAGVAMVLHDKQPKESGLWYNEETNTFYFVN